MGFLNKFNKLSGKNHSDDHENSLVIGHTKKPQISHEAPKKVVKKKIIMKGQYPQLTLLKSGGNKYTPEAVPDYGDWCENRQKLHYGQKMDINRPFDFTKKKKVTKRGKSSEEIDQNLVQPGKYQTTELLEEGIVIKSSEVKSQKLVQPEVYQTPDLLEKEKSVKSSEENNLNLVQPGNYQTPDLLEKKISVKSSEEIDLNLQNLVQPGKYQTTDLLEKEIVIESSEVKSQNLIQPDVYQFP